MKNTTIATLLNFIPGLGYIYVGGKKRWFGAMLVLAIGLSFYVTISSPTYQTVVNETLQTSQNDAKTESVQPKIDNQSGFISIIVSLLVTGAFMYDGYQSCKQHNIEYESKLNAKAKKTPKIAHLK